MQPSDLGQVKLDAIHDDTCNGLQQAGVDMLNDYGSYQQIQNHQVNLELKAH